MEAVPEPYEEEVSAAADRAKGNGGESQAVASSFTKDSLQGLVRIETRQSR